MKRWAIRISLTLVVLVAALLLGAWLMLRASLPQLEGDYALDGLRDTVSIARDERGVATVTAGNLTDLSRATGFLHAQERFFQMDLLRRSAAGEMSALVGAAALDYDRARRIHDLRRVARDVVATSSPEDQESLTAYAEGVNAGLAALGVRPFEYGILRTAPQPWRPEDSVLTAFAMYFDLHDENARRDRYLAALYDTFPADFVDFLVPPGTEWDAPVLGEPFVAATIPGPDIIDFRQRLATHTSVAMTGPAEPHAPGSNSWAVDGARSVTGAAIVANDMHLGLRVPNVWFRLRLELEGPDGFAVTGVSLPGIPAVVAGSNGHIAWSFTNSYGDWIDLVRLDEADCETGYGTPDGCQDYESVVTEIEVAHAEPVAFEYRRTRWGPVLEDQVNDREIRYAVHWLAHHPEATNLRPQDLAGARDMHAALAVAHRAGIPPQNFIVADRSGGIAWSIIGRMPRREGHDGRLPLASATTHHVWNGWLESEEYPAVINPPHGRLWSANARMADGDPLARLGDGGYALGARARQIRDRLFEQEQFEVADMLRIQLDDEARFLSRWQALLLNVLNDDPAPSPQRRALRDAVAAWEGNAAVDAVAYRLVRSWREEVLKTVFGGLTAEIKGDTPGFGFGALTQSEAPVWQLVNERPPHLLPPGATEWGELLLQAADHVYESTGGDLDGYRWGRRNTARVDHPLGGLPLLGWLVNAPRTELPGDLHMPRVQGPGFGASERFAVSPGREHEGYFHMPGGQSGHPLSPFHLAGHADWERGVATPFLPGPARYLLQLKPLEDR